MEKKRLGVVMYTPTANGGHARYTQEVMRGLSHVAGEVFDFALVSSVDLADEFRSDEYTIYAILPPLKHRTEYSTVLHWAFSRFLYYALREFSFIRWLSHAKEVDVIHLQEIGPWFGSLCIFIIRYYLHRKVVMTVHNIKPHRYPVFMPKKLFDTLNKWVYRQCDHLFVHTDNLVKELSGFYHIDPQKISVAQHGVWTIPTMPQPSNDDSKSSGVVLFFGTIRKNKGLHFLLEAIQLCRNAKKLVIAGYPSEPDYFKESVIPMIDSLRKSGFVIELFDQFITDDQLPMLFGNSTVIVLPYQDFSAQSGVLFDAIAYSLPVVASEVGALGETVNYFRIGKTVSNVLPITLSGAIDEAIELSDKGVYSDSFLKARESLSWSRHGKVLVEVYSEI